MIFQHSVWSGKMEVEKVGKEFVLWRRSEQELRVKWASHWGALKEARATMDCSWLPDWFLCEPELFLHCHSLELAAIDKDEEL